MTIARVGDMQGGKFARLAQRGSQLRALELIASRGVDIRRLSLQRMYSWGNGTLNRYVGLLLTVTARKPVGSVRGFDHTQPRTVNHNLTAPPIMKTLSSSRRTH